MAAIVESAQEETTNRATPITCLFVDVGNVLLTDGWDHVARELAAGTFTVDWTEMEARHQAVDERFEEGCLTLEDYLDHVVFYEARPFTRAEFWRFMCAQSKPHPEMIQLVAQLKARHGLGVAVVSNESRELNAYRIKTFELDKVVDSFISSCFVHIRKPNPDIFRLAMDITQTPAEQAVFIDDMPMFVQIAESLGIRSIHHTDYRSTCAKLASFGLRHDGGDIHETC
jgi:putative hydrolase of the HAD superfamily